MSLRKEVPGRMPISAENDDCPPLGKRASSPGSERAAEAKKSRQHETPEVTVLEFEQELAVQEYEQRLAMEHEQRLAVLEYEQRLEDRVQQQQRLEDRLQQQQQRLDVLENALAKMSERMECAICHEIMHEPTTLVPCLHSFCGACVKKRRNPLCPVCRGRVESESCNVHLADIIEHFLEAHPDRRSAAKVTADLERDLLATLDESSKKAVGNVVTDLVHGSVTQVKFEDNMLKGPTALQAANAVARAIAHCSSLQSFRLPAARCPRPVTPVAAARLSPAAPAHPAPRCAYQLPLRRPAHHLPSARALPFVVPFPPERQRLHWPCAQMAGEPLPTSDAAQAAGVEALNSNLAGISKPEGGMFIMSN